MTPEERQMLGGLFQRVNSAAATQRDPEAESFINDAVRTAPHSPYVLAQTVLVQQQALEAAANRISQLEAAAQQGAARGVPLKQIAPGDLVFFRIHSASINHVGIYTGAGRFVHAPHAGQAVTYGELKRGFYAQHLVSAGRFW